MKCLPSVSCPFIVEVVALAVSLDLYTEFSSLSVFHQMSVIIVVRYVLVNKVHGNPWKPNEKLDGLNMILVQRVDFQDEWRG
jgi:hypothetical protein